MDNISTLLERARAVRVFSGAVFIYGNSKGITAEGSVGTLAWDGEPVESNSLWDLASVSKPLIMLSLMKLVEQGEVSLDDPISYFLPSYLGTNKADITLFELLTHTSGIPGQQPLYKQVKTPEEMREAVRQLPLRNKIGSTVEYTSQGYMILGDIIESVTGNRLDTGMKELVFAPLGIVNTMFNPPEQYINRMAATEYCSWRNQTIRGMVHDENCVVLGGIAGHAGLFGTAKDLSIICQMMLRMGRTDNEEFLNPLTIKLMTENHTKSLNLARALGWQGKDLKGSPAGDLFSPTSYGHTGFTGTSLWMDPEKDVFAILLTNRVHPTRENEKIKRIRAIYHNLAILDMQKIENKVK
ncbi:serine hydrolase domain-containing protein [Neobacillus novalis]|uniref:Serine hydrolase domain-containing protein n=1 Tax=Neobacillus novalis TaxID=220687 RepID=A0AA95MPG9_9BACI|nr:serine hydrolase domain-containing protein [Neobacillus novalis]WHY85974.1 serine hydrolase domain-containing protein [Neobacillus novalis]